MWEVEHKLALEGGRWWREALDLEAGRYCGDRCAQFVTSTLYSNSAAFENDYLLRYYGCLRETSGLQLGRINRQVR